MYFLEFVCKVLFGMEVSKMICTSALPALAHHCNELFGTQLLIFKTDVNKLQPWGISGPLLVFKNEVLLEHRHFCSCSWPFWHCTSRVK